MHVLIVEDEPEMAGLLSRGLQEEQYEVSVARDGHAALELSAGEKFDVILLDLMLPRMNGLEVARRLRHREKETPVLMLTARDSLSDVVNGLDAGADDYLTKPFSFLELLARIRALIRRKEFHRKHVLEAEDLVLDLTSHRAFRGGTEVHLSLTEFRLLEMLVRNSGRIVSRREILDTVWGKDREVTENTLDAFVRLLRKKVDQDYENKIDPHPPGIRLFCRSCEEPVKLTIRARLTLLYFIVLAVSFAGFFWICDIGFQRSIDTTVNDASRTNLEIVRRVMNDAASKGPEKLEKEFGELSAVWANGAIFEVAGPDGHWIFRSPKLVSPQPPLTPYTGERISFDTANLDAQQYRIARERIKIQGTEYTISSAVPTEPFDQALDNFRLTEQEFLPLLVVIASLLGYWLSGRALSPVSRITKSAARIGVQDLSQRLEVPRAQDELRHLTETLNAMLGRIESSVNRIRQFTADASHDLRTPVALIRTNAELALRRPRTDAEYRETLSRILGTSEETTKLIEKLLTLARADAGVASLHFSPVHVGPCLRKIAGEARVLAAGKNICLMEELAAEPAHVLADTAALERLLIALLDNAVKYTPENGNVCLRSYAENDFLVVEVQDSGIGIAESDLPNIFERFYRADQTRTRRVGGAGLGLSIAKWIAEAHRGSIRAFSRLGEGSLFRVCLPLINVQLDRDVATQEIQHSPASAD